MKEIVLIGGGGHCRSVIDVIEQEAKYKIAGILEKPELSEIDILSYKVIGEDSDLLNLAKKYQYAFISMGQIKTASIRKRIFLDLESIGFEIPYIVSPRAYVSRHSSLGKGSIVMHGATLNANATVGENCIINSKALIEHDSVVQSHCHISTNVVLNGSVEIGQESFIGSGAIIIEGVKVKPNSFIKAGSVIK